MDGAFYEQSIWQRMGMRHPGGRESTRRLAELTEEFWNEKEEKELINLCCGSGEGMELFREHGFSVTGIDCSSRLLWEAEQRFPDMKWICADAGNLPFEEERFPCVLSECSFSEAENLKERLLEAHRILKPGGLLLGADVAAAEETARRQWDEEFVRAGFALLYQEAHEDWIREFLARFLWEASGEEQELLCKSWKKWKRAEYVLAVYRRC